MPQSLASSYGQVVLGPPGSGKTTYAHVARKLLSQSRKTVVVNLDPANESGWSGVDIIDIRRLVTAQEASRYCHLGPNGSFVFCLEFLDSEMGRAWLVRQMASRETGTYFLFDLPGQVELVTHHLAIHNVLSHLMKAEGMRLVAVHLVDCMFALEAAKFISVALLSLSTMMRLALPHINVLSKVDLLDPDQLDFNLDFYTHTPNFAMLADRVSAPPNYRRLTASLCELLDEYNQVAFKLVSARDEASVLDLIAECDRACGFLNHSQRSPVSLLE